jgi:two-component system cell cycle response regulator
MEIDLKKFEQMKATGELPSPKGAALTIVRLAQMENVSGSQLEQVIKSDPAFVGRLLKTANITGRESGRPIASVHDAINVLGLAVVRNLALGFSLVSSYRGGACANFDYPVFWTRAIVNALALQSIIRRTCWASPDEAFCCGLLADIGKLALATVHSDAYSRLLGEFRVADISSADRDALLRAREVEAFALHHDDLTAAMLSEWGFPRVLIEPLYFCNFPELSDFSPESRSARLLGAVRLASSIAEVCMAAPELRQAGMPMLIERAKFIQLEPEVLENIVDGVVLEWGEWSKILQLDSPEPVPAFATLLHPEPSDSGEMDVSLAPVLRVLLAGEESPQRKELEDLLLGLGYQVFTADDGHLALELALVVQPHILIAERQMSGLGGLQLTQSLRDTRFGRGIFVLILSEQEDEALQIEAFAAGADEFLSKPLNSRVLAARLRSARRVFQLQEEVQDDHEQMKHFAAELAVSNRRLHEASVTDALTGFHNRRYAMERIEKDWAASSRNGRQISCMMIDLDNFKRINDTYGHDFGDKVLVAIAGVLKKTLRSQDVICRVGGDEFLVICPDSDAQAVRLCAERLLLAADSVAIDSSHGVVRCGISIGVATRSADMVNTGMLIKAADEGMYQAKVGGRGMVVERFD